jgi:hypothetical protein
MKRDIWTYPLDTAFDQRLSWQPAADACAIEHAQRLESAARWPERFMYLLAAVLFVVWLVM